jgi:hypothetical protein
MSSAFQPSAESANGISSAVIQQTYPSGEKGIAFSLEQVAARMLKGRLDPRVRSWAIRTLHEAGDPQGTVNRTQALLDGLRKAAIYVNDPINSEYMQAAHETLCLDDKGFCFKGGDCDDLAIALGSATLSVGIPTYVVAQAFNNEDLPSHVLIGVEDPQSKDRYRVDPSTKNDVGYISHYTREWWIDPMSTAPITLTGETKADFVGVGAFQQATAVTAAVYTATLSQVQAVTKSLSDALISAEAQYNLLEQASLILRPNAPYDAEPKNPIQSLADFPVNGTWTPSMSTIAGDTIATGKVILAALNDALSGARTIYLAANSVDVFIEAREQDSVFYQILVEGVTDSIIGFLNPTGVVLGGVTTLLGRLLTPAQVTNAQQAQANGQPTGLNGKGLGVAPTIVFAYIVGGVIVSVAAAIAFVKLLDFLITALRMIIQKRQIEAAAACLQAGTCTVDQYNGMVKVAGDQRVAEINAQTEQDKNDPWKDRIAQIGDIFMWVAIGGVAIAGLMTVGPFIAEAGAEYRARGQARRSAPPEPIHTPLEPKTA